MAGPGYRQKAGRIGRLFRTGLAVLLAARLGSAPALAQENTPTNQPGLIRDTEIEAILKADASPIFKAAGLNPDNIHIYIVADKEMNAFVAGGQNLFLNTGLIVRTKTPNELIGVIAHETGHMAGGHLSRTDEGSRAASATQLITLGLGMVAAFAGHDPNAAAALLYSADEFAALQFFTFTRVQEASADQAAARFLESSGQSGKGLVEFFNNFLYDEVNSNARRDKFFQSHPLTADRISALRTKVQSAAHYSAVDSPEALAQHATMIAKLKAFMDYPVLTYQAYPDTDTSFPARYARAIAYYRDLETPRALDAIDALISDYPTNPYLWELKGQILFEFGRVEEALAPQKQASGLMPDAPLLRISYGQTLLANGAKSPENIKAAIENLRRGVTLEKENGLGWRLLAQAYERDNNPGMARLASAEEKFAEGQMIEARSFAGRARELLTQGTPEYREANDIINAAEVTVDSHRGRSG